MAIDNKLQILLDQADPDELIDVILILEGSAITSKLKAVDPANLAAGRKIFAKSAGKLLNKVIRDASKKSGKTTTDLTIFERMASAQLRAPAKLLKQLAEHPAVATIGLASDK